ncbi:MAG TPA: dehydrogenase E1 component subunit alpha/beta [Thermoanaerobaculia bacterium]|nr:dehydrogenase E1 component subunit alpha/beta [Thermoanaerobaculia bacterium]
MTAPDRASAPQSLAAEDLRRQLRYAVMKLSRELDARFESLRLGGRVAKWYSAIGNEATTAPAGLLLEPGDVLCSLHRDLAAILGYYLDPERTFPGFGFDAIRSLPPSRPEPRDLLRRLCCQLLGKGEGFSQGIERSFHYGYFHRESGLAHVGMISHLGSMIPVAAGCAFALSRGEQEPPRLAINFIGEGGTSTGDFHEGLNLAAVWRLPLILVIENNRYAFSTPAAAQYAAARLSDRGVGYGIEAATVDGNDADAVESLLERAAAHVRSGRGPFLVEAMVGRMRGHAEGDDSLKVVPRTELEGYLDEDPVPAYAERLERDRALDPSTRARLDARIAELVEDAVDYGLTAAAPAAAVARRPAFAPVTAAWRGGRATSAPRREELSYVDAVHRALLEELERDPSVILLGQDIAAFEGAFRVTRGFHARWPHRVLDTPISESGTIGLAVGAALLGYRPVIEMQFADFVSCAFNQIVNVAAKLYYRFEQACPLVIRLPSGGRVGAGAFHSQNPEAWFAHTAGLKVVCPATAEDAHDLLVAAIRDPNPVVFCEHKYLYRRIKGRLGGPIPAGEEEPLGSSRVLREGNTVTLVGYGATTWTCNEAADLLASRGADAEVVDLRTLVPFDAETVLDSVRKTGRVIVVHEAQATAGFGAEVAAVVAERAFAWLDAPVRRVAYPDLPVPFVKSLEQELLPSAQRVAEVAEDLLAY